MHIQAPWGEEPTCKTRTRAYGGQQAAGARGAGGEAGDRAWWWSRRHQLVQKAEQRAILARDQERYKQEDKDLEIKMAEQGISCKIQMTKCCICRIVEL